MCHHSLRQKRGLSERFVAWFPTGRLLWRKDAGIGDGKALSKNHRNKVFVLTHVSLVLRLLAFCWIMMNASFILYSQSHPLLSTSDPYNIKLNYSETLSSDGEVGPPAKDSHHALHISNDTQEESILLARQMPNKNTPSSRPRSPVLDVLSIASLSQIELVQTQQATWGSHSSVRDFLFATEEDDPDPHCSSNRNLESAWKQVQYCRSGRGWQKILGGKINGLAHHLRNSFASREWLEEKSNPVAWLCAQVRFPVALSRIGKTYRRRLEAAEKSRREHVLPDYLLFVDDDTWVNVETLHQWMQRDNQSHPIAVSTPVVYGGCVVRSPVHQLNWTLPWGGFGTYFNRPSLERLIYPLQCTNVTIAAGEERTVKEQSHSLESFEREACKSLETNLLGEKRYFVPGMSVSDLMGVMASSPRYLCLHSDWITGYFVNFYYLSTHLDTPDGFFRDVLQSRLHGFGEVYGKKVTGGCTYKDATKCTAEAPFCHRMKANEMRDFHEELQKQGRAKMKNGSIA